MELWREICSDSHQAGSENENRKELEAHMRHLHARETETQAEDRMYLFHPDIEEYIKTSTMAQMAAWINQNEEAIKASIKRAEQCSAACPPLTTYGFTVEKNGQRKKKNRISRRPYVRWKWEDMA